ncbi:hypothetical protein Tco_0497782 [Tanacetum coccineum]
MMQSYCEIMSQRREQEAILLQDEEKQELLAEEHAASPSSLSPELFPDEVKRIQQILERTSFDAITPDFPITDSLIPCPTGSESEDLSKDLSDIESECDVPVCDNFTTFFNPLFDVDNDFYSSDDKSFSNDDVPKGNFKFFSNPLSDEEIISTKIDPHHFNAESDLIESLLNRDISIVSSPKFDSLLEEFSGELAHIDLIPSGINEADFDPEEEIRLIAPDYEASRARGFVLRSLELQSLA